MNFPFFLRRYLTAKPAFWLGAVGLGSSFFVLSAEPELSAPVAEILIPARVNEWVAVMTTNHPALRAAQSRARAATLNAEGVRRLADPKVIVGGTVYSARGNNPADEGNLIYGVEQPLPLVGKEAAARAVATAEADTAAARTDARFQELRRDLAKALFLAALAREQVEITREDQAWLTETVHTLEARLASGSARSVEVLRAQAEHARRAAELETLISRQSEAEATVNRQLGFLPDSPLPLFALPGIASPVPYRDSLVRLALAAEPRLHVLATERRAAAAIVEATKRSQRPDFALGVEGRQYGGDGGFREGTFLLSMNLPWLNRGNYRRDLARDRERLRAVEDDHTDTALGLREEIHHLTLEIAAARREALLYQDDILPRSQQSFAAALAQWSSGQGELRDLLESRRLVFESRLQRARALTAQWTALAELVLCCGLGDLEALQMLESSAPDSVPTPPETK